MFDKALIGIYLRGIAMGAADVVPGVSGGTVAFITGIYSQLLHAIKAINITALRVLWLQGFGAFWRTINGTFLSVLLLGIVTSIALLARVISFLLAAQPLLIWSFFFGLIIASAVHIGKQVRRWDIKHLGMLLLGVFIAYMIISIKPAELPATPLLVFLAGSIAICAMILPGISGSFILVLMGMYHPILLAVKEFNLLLLGCFAAGAGVGIVSFAHLLSWLLDRFESMTMSLLTGFLLGSLYLVWPWKQTVSYYENSKGQSVALEQLNVLPQQFSTLTGEPANTLFCVLLAVLGVVIVLFLEKMGRKSSVIK